MSKTINVGLIGFGTVGQGVVRVLQKTGREIERKKGLRIRLRKICDKDIRTKRSVKVNRKLLTTDARDILEDPDIDIVIELIGGLKPAKEFVLLALRNRKHVVMANKFLLARNAAEIFKEAKKRRRLVGFEAAVAGGIPIVKSIKEGLIANKIEYIYAIVNGTCNYILTKMSEDGIEFEQALALARQKGFAEANPALDIRGIDSMHKLILLTLLAFGVKAREKDVFVEGITNITERDIQYAKELGYAIKLLAIAKNGKKGLEVRVHPTMLPKEYLLSAVRDEFNAIYVKGDAVGATLFYGKGAGMLPAASAVVADLIEIAEKIKNNTSAVESIAFSKGKIADVKNAEMSYYLCFSVIDKPRVLAQISKILGNHNISIASVIQKERRVGKIVPLILTTHITTEGKIQHALKEIDVLDCIKAKTQLIRVEK